MENPGSATLMTNLVRIERDFWFGVGDGVLIIGCFDLVLMIEC